MTEPTIRQQIIDALEAILIGMNDQLVGSDRIWQKVVFGDLDDVSASSYPLIGIDEGTEVVTENFGGCTYYDLPVFIHFRFTSLEGVANLKKYKYYLGLLQLAVLANHNLGGLSIDIVEEGNSPAIVGQSDTHPGGSLNLIIRYRTQTHNPYKLFGTP